jgi:hypothetical protein
VTKGEHVRNSVAGSKTVLAIRFSEKRNRAQRLIHNEACGSSRALALVFAAGRLQPKAAPVEPREESCGRVTGYERVDKSWAATPRADPT